MSTDIIEIKNKFKKAALEIKEATFENLALEIFRFQAIHNSIYKAYLEHLKCDIENIKTISEIPFLPISFFKSHKVISGEEQPNSIIFESSGTTGITTSRHYLQDVNFYKKSSKLAFNAFYGDLKDYHILALLPSYLERGNSSLVFMADYFISEAQKGANFYLYNYEELLSQIVTLKTNKRKILLIGVTFALLDLAEKYAPDLSEVIIMETGGMKGKRKEMIREALHQQLSEAFNVSKIHSEYGMTELLSQAYSKGDGLFFTPPWLKILLRDINDPFSVSQHKKSGGVNIIDLANVDSCCFIETQDIGSIDPKTSGFRILGRFDNSDVRGCNLLIS